MTPNFSSYKKLCLPPSLGKGETPGRKFTAALVQFYKQTKCQAGIVGGGSQTQIHWIDVSLSGDP